MNIHALFPNGIRDGLDSVGADVVDVLTAAIHLDRRNARRIGWRGLRPCMSTGYAWTIRAAERQGVYGLVFLDEERDHACLRSRFSLFYFPDPDEAVLSAHLLDARKAAAGPDYFADIRDFTRRETSKLFFLGLMSLNVRLDLKGLSFDLAGPTRHRVVAVDGLPEDGVEKGGWACDIPSLGTAMLFFRLIGLSTAWLLECAPQWAISRIACPVAAFTAEGEWGSMEGETLPGFILSAGFGDAVPPDPAYPAPKARPCSGRAFTLKEQAEEDFRPVLHVVSGFLGSGKTTFLSQWLAWLHNHDRHTAVLQNELGEKNLDAFLLKHETVTETLDEGCVCCTLADSLRPAIRRLLEALPTEQIILETTGLANPGAVADTLEELADLVRPGLRISLVDMLDEGKFVAGDFAGPSGLAGEQIRWAEVLVCNKADAVSPEYLAEITQILKNMNPDAVIFHASYGRIPFGELDRLLERFTLAGSKAAVFPRSKTARRITHLDEEYESLAIEVTRPMTAKDLEDLVRLTGERTPRVKGIVDLANEGRPMIVQYAAGVLELEAPLSPPDQARFLVLIGKGFDAAFTASLARIPGLAVTAKSLRV